MSSDEENRSGASAGLIVLTAVAQSRYDGPRLSGSAKVTANMAHESLNRDQQVAGSSDRSFGLVFAGVFLVVALWPLFYEELPRWWASGVAAGFAMIALWKPELLARLNRLWFRFGILLGKVVSPVALGVLFYCVVAPIGVLVRLAGKDPLRLKLDSDADSYWIPRKPPGPPPDSMTNQF